MLIDKKDFSALLMKLSDVSIYMKSQAFIKAYVSLSLIEQDKIDVHTNIKFVGPGIKTRMIEFYETGKLKELEGYTNKMAYLKYVERYQRDSYIINYDKNYIEGEAYYTSIQQSTVKFNEEYEDVHVIAKQISSFEMIKPYQSLLGNVILLTEINNKNFVNPFIAELKFVKKVIEKREHNGVIIVTTMSHLDTILHFIVSPYENLMFTELYYSTNPIALKVLAPDFSVKRDCIYYQNIKVIAKLYNVDVIECVMGLKEPVPP
jgi:DNA polymerase/3'-5' exonuclease PolX